MSELLFFIIGTALARPVLGYGGKYAPAISGVLSEI